MAANAMLKVRSDLHAGRKQDPNWGPQQYGWWWMQNGYIARPGRPVKGFGGWYYGPAPTFYSPGGYGGGLGAGMGGDASVGEGSIAPDAP